MKPYNSVDPWLISILDRSPILQSFKDKILKQYGDGILTESRKKEVQSEISFFSAYQSDDIKGGEELINDLNNRKEIPIIYIFHFIDQLNRLNVISTPIHRKCKNMYHLSLFITNHMELKDYLDNLRFFKFSICRPKGIDKSLDKIFQNAADQANVIDDDNIQNVCQKLAEEVFCYDPNAESPIRVIFIRTKVGVPLFFVFHNTRKSTFVKDPTAINRIKNPPKVRYENGMNNGDGVNNGVDVPYEDGPFENAFPFDDYQDNGDF